MDVAGDFELKGGKTAFMLAEFLAIEEDDGLIIGGAEPEEQAAAGLLRVIEFALIPDGSFVPEEFRLLGVPVTGHLEYRGVRHEGEFQAIALVGGDAVGAEPAAWNGMQMEVVVAGFVGIDDDLPWPVQAEVLAGGRVLDQPDLLGVTRDTTGEQHGRQSR